MGNIATKFGLGAGGVNFSDPWKFTPMSVNVGGFKIYDNANTGTAASTTAFFTELATRGFQDTTNWTAGTYKTLLNVTGKGYLAALIACTAGGAETTTFELTVDGVLTEITITNAVSERALLCSGVLIDASFTTANAHMANAYGPLQASATTFGPVPTTPSALPHWGWLDGMGVPKLQFNTSLLVRAKHSTSITNSTATAYSGGMYRVGITA